ncbi:hypothetical protein DesfrDRAFT_1376 [Solidesulfovibrio fructosivorans JJ]]|uniref:Uncharacterized protein n=1 Tax=Solidesulfovibrio fructosivorans JJ] TaxID=596151 RepID=E1JUS7_SOLFR|nr:hypothetical protein DesfrDRAFT_1376 [Solidesulfovibrio fructosivorans JJ]]
MKEGYPSLGRFGMVTQIALLHRFTVLPGTDNNDMRFPARAGMFQSGNTLLKITHVFHPEKFPRG